MMKFNYNTIEILILSSALDLREMKTSFRMVDICQFVTKFYPQNIAQYDMIQSRMQLEHFDHVRQLYDFGALKTISDLSLVG